MAVDRLRQAVAWVLAVPLVWVGTAVPILGPGHWLALSVLGKITQLLRPRRIGRRPAPPSPLATRPS
jgi:hypothetical protein